MAEPLRMLIVEDAEDDALLSVRELKKAGFDVTWQRVETSAAMAQALDAEDWDLILADYRLPRFSGEEALYVAQQHALDVPFIIVSGIIGEETAVAMMKAGADDYILKDNLARLAPAVERELEEARTRRERREAQQALKESEQRYRRLFETANDGIWVIDAESRTTLVNEQMADMLGWTPGEMLGRHFFEFMDEEARAEAEGNLERRRQAVREQHEFRFRRKDGSPLWALVSTNPLLDDDGTYEGALAMVTDITERRTAEEALRRSEHLHAEAQRVAHVGHWELVPEEGRPRWSPEIFRIFGLDPEGTEPTFKEHERYLHPDDWPTLNDAVGRALQNGTPFGIEFRLFRPDGEMRWMHTIGTTETREDGTVARAFGTAQDVTERRGAEEALRENERFLQTVFDGIQDGITVRDRDLTLLKVNRWMEERFAHRMPLVGHKCYEVFQCRDDVCPWCPAVRAMETGETHSEVVPYPCIDDPTGWLELTAFPLRNADGEVVGVIEHVKDVTARIVAEHESEAYHEHLRRLAAELVQAEERERRRLATNLHDSVGQTLASAKLTLQGLAQQARANPALAKRFRQVSELVGEAVEHTRSTVFDLSPPILQEVGLEAALESLVHRTEQLHGLPIALEEAASGPAMPLSEEVRTVLYRSARELLHNVVRHAAASRAAVSVSRADDHIRIVVEDDGVGFDPEAARDRGGVGGGFGLFDIRERLDYLGGHVDIRSIPEQGTRVALTAPLEPPG